MVRDDGRQKTIETREQGRILLEYVLLVVVLAGLVMTTTLFLGVTIRDLYDKTEAALFPTTNSDSQGNQGITPARKILSWDGSPEPSGRLRRAVPHDLSPCRGNNGGGNQGNEGGNGSGNHGNGGEQGNGGGNQRGNQGKP